MKSFKERHDEYESKSSIAFPIELPIVVRAELRNYKKIIESLPHPYSAEFIDIMSHAMLYCASDIHNAALGYLHNKEITFILTPHSAPWCQNDLQKLITIIASTLTAGFYRIKDLCYKELPIGDPAFSCIAFALPSLSEACNHIILRQQLGYKFVINEAAIYNLSTLYDKRATYDALINRSDEEKLSILRHTCDVDFDQYPTQYRNGIALYKNCITINTKAGIITRNKWELNLNVPIFAIDKEFLENILIGSICQT